MINYKGKKYYTTSELCDMIGKSYETVRRWRKQGILDYHETEYGECIYSEESVGNLLGLNSNKIKTTPVFEGYDPNNKKDVL